MKLVRVSHPVAGLLVLAAVGCGGSTFSASDPTTDDGGSGSNATGSGGTSSGSAGSESGTTGTGGGSSTGGTTGVGGTSGTAGTDGTSGSSGTGGSIVHVDAGVQCTGATTTFHLTEAAGTDYCVGTQCTSDWVSVK